MASRRYNPQQIQRQQANSIRRQESSPTVENLSQNEVSYNVADVSSVPSEPQVFEKLMNFFTHYGGWVAFTGTLAVAVGAFLTFQSDLKRAEADIKSTNVLVGKNSDKLVNMDKLYVEAHKDINYMQADISEIEKSMEKSEQKLEQVTLNQLKFQYTNTKDTANKKINKD